MPDFASDGVRLHFELAGPDDGSPTVLVHGFASDYQLNWVGSRWQETLTAAGRLVIGLDVRGHGRSDKPHDPAAYRQRTMAADVVRLLDHLDVGRADLVGYSMGARIGMRVAFEHPGRLWRAVLGGPGRWHDVERTVAIAAALRARRPSEGGRDGVARTFLEFASARPVNDLEALACCIEGFTPDLGDDEVGRIRVPLLVVEAEGEEIAPGAAEIAGLVPDARYLVLPGRTHMNAVPARQFKEAAVGFLDQA
ncbi:MAG: alpha/beta fold hydrolase [Candidatus Dormibacteraceae bacterium]